MKAVQLYTQSMYCEVTAKSGVYGGTARCRFVVGNKTGRYLSYLDWVQTQVQRSMLRFPQDFAKTGRDRQGSLLATTLIHQDWKLYV